MTLDVVKIFLTCRRASKSSLIVTEPSSSCMQVSGSTKSISYPEKTPPLIRFTHNMNSPPFCDTRTGLCTPFARLPFFNGILQSLGLFKADQSSFQAIHEDAASWDAHLEVRDPVLQAPWDGPRMLNSASMSVGMCTYEADVRRGSQIRIPGKAFPSAKISQASPICLPAIFLSVFPSPITMANAANMRISTVQRRPFADCSVHAARQPRLIARANSSFDSEACIERRAALLAGLVH